MPTAIRNCEVTALETLFLLSPYGIAAAFALVASLAFMTAGFILLYRPGAGTRTAVGWACITAAGVLFGLGLFASTHADNLLWLRNLLILAKVAVCTALLVLLVRRKAGRAALAVAGCGIAFMLGPGVALAADGTSVDLRPLTDVLIGGAATILSGIITIGALWLRHYLKVRLGIELDASTRDYVRDAADRAVDLLKARLERHAGKSSLTVDVHNALVADAVDMLAEQVPDGLTRLGLTSDNIRQMLLTRLAARGFLPPDDAAPAGAGLSH